MYARNFLCLFELILFRCGDISVNQGPIQDSEVCPVGYSIVRNDGNGNGGGVAFSVSERVRYKPCIDLCNGHIESIWIQLYPISKRSVLFRCTYKPPSCSCVDYYEELSLECDNGFSVGNQSFSILGDLNSDLLNTTNIHRQTLVKFYKSLSLCQLVQELTRITSVSSTLIDVIVINRKDCFTDTAVYSFGISDHHLVTQLNLFQEV